MLATPVNTGTQSRGTGVVITPGCSFCGKDYPKDRSLGAKCTRCLTRFYCSEQCRKDDWRLSHSKECKRWRRNSISSLGTAEKSAPVVVGAAAALPLHSEPHNVDPNCAACHNKDGLEGSSMVCHGCAALFCGDCAPEVGEHIDACPRCHASFYCSDEELYRRLNRLLKSRVGSRGRHVPVAQYQLGMMHLTGDGTKKDEAVAAWWFLLAAKGGVARAQVKLGVAYEKGQGIDQDFSSAVRWYRQACSQGDAFAAFKLGCCYEKGQGTLQDDAAALRWFTTGAERGNSDAQAALGRIYEDGNLACERNEFLALEWYLKAAEQGVAGAQINLGNFYRSGIAVGQNQSEAERWYMKAAEQGHPGAQRNLGHLCHERDQLSTAVEWYHRAALQGHAEAAFDLALAYERGEGVEQCDENAARWYREAAQSGHAESQYNYGRMLENGFGLCQNELEAAKWYSAAAVQGYHPAYVHLGNLYRNGDGVKRNREKAMRLYEAAGALGKLHLERMQSCDNSDTDEIDSPEDTFSDSPATIPTVTTSVMIEQSESAFNTIFSAEGSDPRDPPCFEKDFSNTVSIEQTVEQFPRFTKTTDVLSVQSVKKMLTCDSAELPEGMQPVALDESCLVESAISNVAIGTTKVQECPQPLEWNAWCRTYGAPITSLVNVVFGESKDFWLDYFKAKSYGSVAVGNWVNSARDVRYVIPRQGLQGKVSVNCCERIIVNKENIIVVEIETKTPGVPYGQSFYTKAQYIFSHEANPDVSTVTVTAGIHWVKSCSLKSTITKKVKAAMLKGLSETMEHMSIVWAAGPVWNTTLHNENNSLEPPGIGGAQRTDVGDQHDLPAIASEECKEPVVPDNVFQESSVAQEPAKVSTVKQDLKESSDVPILPEPLDWSAYERGYDLPASSLHDAVFGEDKSFWTDLFGQKSYTQVYISDWENNARNIQYTIPRKGLQGKVGVQSHESISVHTSDIVVLEVETRTPGVPYGQSFCTCTQYVFQSSNKERSKSTVKVTAGIKWLKSCSLKDTITKKVKAAMLKGIIETLESMHSVWLQIEAKQGLLDTVEGAGQRAEKESPESNAYQGSQNALHPSSIESVESEAQLQFTLSAPSLFEQQREIERREREAARMAEASEAERKKLAAVQQMAEEQALVEEIRLTEQIKLAEEHLKLAEESDPILPETFEWDIWHQEFTASFEELKESVFGESPMFWFSLYTEKGCTDVSISEWNYGSRSISYVIPRRGLQSKVVVTAVEHIRVESRGAIVVEVEYQTPNTSYGNSYCIQTQYVFSSRKSTPFISAVTVSAGIRWIKACTFRDTVTKSVRSAHVKEMKHILEKMSAMWSSPLFSTHVKH